MIKIKYPDDPLERGDFEALYIYYLDLDSSKEANINFLLKKVKFDNKTLDLRKLLTASFNLLIEINNQINKTLNEEERKELTSNLNYDSAQPRIANFYMQQKWVNLESCFYCNLDNIYCFMDIRDYYDGLDFINGADLDELQCIDGIGEKTAMKIIKSRNEKAFRSYNDIPVGEVIKKRIEKFSYVNSHNHFTLDHYFHKEKYPFLALSLYNFVPCCYSCNSKFKKTIEIVGVDKSVFISPSSEEYGISDETSFKLRLHKPLNEISEENHFSIGFYAQENENEYISFLKTFKIFGRYRYHKGEALRLIKTKLKYPNSQISEIAMVSGVSEEEVKNMLFGEELFNEIHSQKPLVKFKRDIAKDISIPGVL